MPESPGSGIRARWMCLRAYSRRVRSIRTSAPWSSRGTTRSGEVVDLGAPFPVGRPVLPSGIPESVAEGPSASNALRRVSRVPLRAARALARIPFPGALVAAGVPCIHDWIRKLSGGFF